MTQHGIHVIINPIHKSPNIGQLANPALAQPSNRQNLFSSFGNPRT